MNTIYLSFNLSYLLFNTSYYIILFVFSDSHQLTAITELFSPSFVHELHTDWKYSATAWFASFWQNMRLLHMIVDQINDEFAGIKNIVLYYFD